jgi:ATP-binding cassette subfamily A (ABC1) protein 3
MAAILGFVIWLLSYVPYFLTSKIFFGLNYISKILLCLFPSTGLAYGLTIISKLEQIDHGLRFSNIFGRITNEYFTLGDVLISFLFSTILFILLTLYFEQVFPGEFGVAKPWWYPVESIIKYIKKKKAKKMSKIKARSEMDEFDDPELKNVQLDTEKIEKIREDSEIGKPLEKSQKKNQSIIKKWFKKKVLDVGDEKALEHPTALPNSFEDEPTDKKISIQIKDLVKRFKNKYAVNHLNLNIFENQITILLGHNGAGKTTLMSMICGMIEPSGGTAIVNGKDIRKDMNLIRQNFGLCPQYDILFDDITTAEHIRFYARLKGKSVVQSEEEVVKYLEMLGLEEKKNTLSRNLSGGQKRRLSIAIALCADSKTVILGKMIINRLQLNTII